MPNFDLGDPYLNFIANREGFKNHAYPDGSQWSIGFGSKATSPHEVIDYNQGVDRLKSEALPAREMVQKQFPNLPSGWHDALGSLTYNAGSKWMNSGLGQALRSGDLDAASQHFMQYNKAGGRYNPGLASRRSMELALANGNGSGPPQRAVQLAQTMQANPLTQPAPQPANPFDSIPQPGADTYGHSSEGIDAAKKAGVWNPPAGFPAMSPMPAPSPQPAQPPDPFQSIPRPAMTQPPVQAPMQVASAAPPPPAPSTGDGDGGGKNGLSGMAGDFSKIAKAFGGGDQPKLEMPPPVPIQYPVAPGLQQARALAMAMAMRPLMNQGQG